MAVVRGREWYQFYVARSQVVRYTMLWIAAMLVRIVGFAGKGPFPRAIAWTGSEDLSGRVAVASHR
jgi:hypothetical protein